MHCLQFKDVSNQYQTIINSTNNKIIQNIYSNFKKYYLFSCNQNNDNEINKEIENFLYGSLKDYKFITFNYICDENNTDDILDVTVCVENHCFIIEKINFNIIQKIFGKLKKDKISLLNVGNSYRNVKKTIEEDRATDDVNQFCFNFIREAKKYPKIKLTIFSITGFLIRRYYYPSKYFNDKSFFSFNKNSKKSKEPEIKADFLDFIFSLNQCDINNENNIDYAIYIYQKLNEFRERIELNELNLDKKNELTIFKKEDFIELRTINQSVDSKFVLKLCIHLKTLYIFVIKYIEEDTLQIGKADREIEFCENYSQHRCFTKFFGFVLNDSNKVMGLVFEYMANGSLYDYKIDKIDETFLFILLLRINQALDYLHKNTFLYRDLKPDNILIDHDFNICISDYETIRHPAEQNEEMTHDLGSDLYASPEQIKGEYVSYPTDIYSFGKLLDYLFNKMDKKNISNNLIYLYKSCTNEDKPNERPTNDDIKSVILKECNSFTIFEQILTNETKEINKEETIQFIYEIVLTIQKQDNDMLKLWLQNIFCFRQFYLTKIYINYSMFNCDLGNLYMMGYDSAVENDFFKAQRYYEKAAKQNNPMAQNNLGVIHFLGICGDKNYIKARKYFELAAKQGFPSSFNNLGELYKTGYGVKKDYIKAKKYYEEGAKLNDSNALNNLGNQYENGLGVEKNYLTAKYYYELAARSMNSKAIFNLGYLYFKGLGVKKDYSMAKLYFEQSADLNNPDSFFVLGLMYSQGYGIKKDYIKAKELFEISAQQENSGALYQLGLFYEKGFGVEQNYQKAKEFYEYSARFDNSYAFLKLGFFYEKGLAVKQDYTKAKELYEISAKLNNNEAFYYLGTLYKNGYGVDQNYEIAKKYFEYSAKYDSYSLLNLGTFYSEGLGVDINYKMAENCFKLAADQNNSKACLRLAIFYLDYLCDEGKYSEALKYLKLAGTKEPKAMNIIGSMYYCGKGVKQDYIKARQYFELAAELNNSDSLFHLGCIYMNALGVQKNIPKAIYYFEKADKLGEFRSRIALGAIYAYEPGIKIDCDRAKWYFESLAKQNNPAGLTYLGFLYCNKNWPKHNYIIAKKCFEMAAKENYLEAFFHLGNLYLDGNGVKRDYQKARKCYEIASKQNNSYAYLYLAIFYQRGYGVKKDYKISKKYFDIAAQLNNSYALFSLGNMFSSGEYPYFDIDKAIEYFTKCSKIRIDKSTIKKNDYGMEIYYTRFNKFRYRAMNDLGLIYLTVFSDITKANEYIKESAFNEYPFGQNNYGLLNQLYFKKIKEAEYYYIRSSKNNFALAYYNLAYLKEIETKTDEAVSFYIKASENENKSLIYRNFQHYDKRLNISKTFIICLANLKLVDYYMSKNELDEAKKYFIRSFSKINLKSYQFKFKYTNGNDFSYLKYFILNFPSFNLKNLPNLPEELKSYFGENQLQNNKKNSNEKITISINKNSNLNDKKEKQNKSNNHYYNVNSIDEDETFENIENLFNYVISKNSLKNEFINEIKSIIQIMNTILYIPPYIILLGRIIISIYKKETEQQYKKEISSSFYEGFGIEI